MLEDRAEVVRKPLEDRRARICHARLDARQRHGVAVLHTEAAEQREDEEDRAARTVSAAARSLRALDVRDGVVRARPDRL